MRNRKRICALLLCLCAALTVFFSAVFIVHAADHDCAGEDCPVCAALHAWKGLLRGLGLAAAAAALPTPPRLQAIFPGSGRRLFAESTPVSLRVRMNN